MKKDEDGYYYDLSGLQFKETPKVLLLYLRRDLFALGDTFDEFKPEIHLRPSLGLQYLVGSLRTINVESVVLDQRVIKYDENSLAEFIKEKGIILVGVFSSTTHAESNADFVKNLKMNVDIPVIVGGPGYTQFEVFLENGADLVVHGEGEVAIKEITQKVQKRDFDWSDVRGISYRKNNDSITTESRELIENLDDIPFPIRDNLIPTTVYRDYYLFGFRPPYITMTTTRGCPYKCTFCDSPAVWQNNLRQRSPDNVLEEIDMAVKRWGIRYIDMCDDVFGLSYRWVEEFSKKLIDKLTTILAYILLPITLPIHLWKTRNKKNEK